MLKNYFPTWHVSNIYEIDFEKLKAIGIKGIIFDIDNTLVHHGDNSNEKVDAFFAELKKTNLKLIFLSDNSKERIERFNKNINIPYIEEAGKPSPASYLKALSILQTSKSDTVVIGDQVFKDILGANNSGIKSIHVDFIKLNSEKRIGVKRYFEKIILFFFSKSKKCKIGINIKIKSSDKQKKLFCQRNALFYKISVAKETLKRHLKNFFCNIKFAHRKSSEQLPVLVWKYESVLIKTGKGIDPQLQQNKAVNINLAAKKINGIIISPGEVFSFWKTVGKTSVLRGYKKGRVIINKKLIAGTGGGLCNLGNTINQLVLHSPLDITELHFHSDCLSLEKEHHIFSSGTSVDYNYIDFRFKNNTDQKFQLLTWCDSEKLYAQLRCEKDIDYAYDLEEENRHYEKINETYYCFSKIYKVTKDKNSGKQISKDLIRDNKSEVMFDYSLLLNATKNNKKSEEL